VPPAAPPPASAAVAEKYDGVIMSHASRVIAAEVDGRIERVLVQNGQRVTAGAPVAELDQKDLDKQIEAARGAEDTAAGELLSARSSVAEAARVYHQQQGLFKDGAVSRDAVSSAASAYAIASAQVKTASGALRRAKAAREQTEQMAAKAVVTAPIDGVITTVKVDRGQVAQRGMPIARVFDPSDLWVRFAVPPESLDKVAVGDRITATPLHGGRALTATITVVNRTLEPPLRFAVVEADLDDASLPDHDTLLGEMVDVTTSRPSNR
jgi:RND family efflux transporter MFP subunit